MPFASSMITPVVDADADVKQSGFFQSHCPASSIDEEDVDESQIVWRVAPSWDRVFDRNLTSSEIDECAIADIGEMWESHDRFELTKKNADWANLTREDLLNVIMWDCAQWLEDWRERPPDEKPTSYDRWRFLAIREAERAIDKYRRIVPQTAPHYEQLAPYPAPTHIRYRLHVCIFQEESSSDVPLRHLLLPPSKSGVDCKPALLQDQSDVDEDAGNDSSADSEQYFSASSSRSKRSRSPDSTISGSNKRRSTNSSTYSNEDSSGSATSSPPRSRPRAKSLPCSFYRRML